MFLALFWATGAPLILRPNSESGHTVSVKRSDSAVLSLVVCADPRPRHVAWEWGSLRLEAGAGIGKYNSYVGMFQLNVQKGNIKDRNF